MPAPDRDVTVAHTSVVGTWTRWTWPQVAERRPAVPRQPAGQRAVLHDLGAEPLDLGVRLPPPAPGRTAPAARGELARTGAGTAPVPGPGPGGRRHRRPGTRPGAAPTRRSGSAPGRDGRPRPTRRRGAQVVADEVDRPADPPRSGRPCRRPAATSGSSSAATAAHRRVAALVGGVGPPGLVQARRSRATRSCARGTRAAARPGRRRAAPRRDDVEAQPVVVVRRQPVAHFGAPSGGEGARAPGCRPRAWGPRRVGPPRRWPPCGSCPRSRGRPPPRAGCPGRRPGPDRGPRRPRSSPRRGRPPRPRRRARRAASAYSSCVLVSSRHGGGPVVPERLGERRQRRARAVRGLEAAHRSSRASVGEAAGALAALRGRNPSKQNRSTGRPETASAVSTAEGPARRSPARPPPPRPRPAGSPGRRRWASWRRSPAAPGRRPAAPRAGPASGRLVALEVGDHPTLDGDAQVGGEPLEPAGVLGGDHVGRREPRRAVGCVRDPADGGRGEHEHTGPRSHGPIMSGTYSCRS